MSAATHVGAEDAPSPAREDHLRAGYLLNFAKFVEWPSANAADTLTVCFIGANGIREAFVEGVGNKPIGRHPVTTRILTKKEPVAGCQILYVAAAAVFSADAVIGTAGAEMLTVADVPDFIHKGGIVELFTEDNRLRFNINLDNARHSGLRISSSLLQLASRVEENGR